MKILPIALLTSSLIYSSGSTAADIESVTFCNDVERAARHIYNMRQNNAPISQALNYIETLNIHSEYMTELVSNVYQMPIAPKETRELMAMMLTNGILEGCLEGLAEEGKEDDK